MLKVLTTEEELVENLIAGLDFSWN
jgi:hypothetical protein